MPDSHPSAEHLRILLDNIRDYAVFQIDLARRVVTWNAGAERVLGFSEADVLGQSADLIFTPEDRERGEPDREMQQARDHGRAEDDRWHVRKDGTRFWASGVLAPVYQDGTLQGYVKVLRDTTKHRRAEQALRESEQRFRLFVENVQEYALFQTDPQGHVTSWNPGAERLFGYSSAELLGQHVSRLLTPEDHQAQFFEHELAFVTAGNRNEDARWLVRKDGTRFWARWVTEPVRDDAGQIRGVAKVLRDETERKQQEQQLQRSLAEKTILVREIHHRVKNNLQVIISLLRLQSYQTGSPALLDVLEELQGRIRAIAQIHERLYQSHNLAEIDFQHYLTQLVHDLVGLHTRTPKDIQLALQIEPVVLSLEQALPLGLIANELILNSLKHGLNGQPGRLEVSLAFSAEGNSSGEGEKQDQRWMRLGVIDSGPGLPVELDVHQAESMGLSLVNLLVEQLQGKLEVGMGAGAQMAVVFPLPPPKYTRL
jgi:PAS domain S-box-containing protein